VERDHTWSGAAARLADVLRRAVER
jgi:hypothetical protein